MTECLVSADKDEVLLPIENPQGITVHLEAGMQLGSVQTPPSLPLGPEEQSKDDSGSSRMSIVKIVTHTPKRLQALLQALGLPMEKLTAEGEKAATISDCRIQ